MNTDFTSYVKRLEDKKAYEVKIGAGTNPIIVTDYEIQVLMSMSNGTAIPAIPDFLKKCNAIQLINEWKDNNERLRSDI